MHSTNYFGSLEKNPYILIRNGKVVQISEPFTSITEYTIKDLVNLKMEDVLITLRFSPKESIETINEEAEYFIFTKSLEVRFVNVQILDKENEQVIIIKEKPNSRFDYRFNFLSQLSLQNVYGDAVYSVPDFVLLKANEVYLSSLDAPNNNTKNAIGKTVSEIYNDWDNSSIKGIWNKITENGKSEHIKEFELDGDLRGVTYWDTTLIPLFENGILKYIIINAQDVTERVLYRKNLEEKTKLLKQQNEAVKFQQKKLEAIIESTSEGLFLINKDESITFLNDEARNFFYDYKQCKKLGDSHRYTKYFDKNGRTVTIKDMPGFNILNGEKVKDFFLTVKRPDKTLHVHVNGAPIYGSDGNIASALICLKDVTKLVNSERKNLEQKEQLEAIIENMSDAVFIADKENKFILMNHEARNKYFNKNEIKNLGDGLDLAKCMDSDGKLLTIEKLPSYRALRGERVTNFRSTVEHLEKKWIVDMNASPIYDNNGDIVMAVVCVHDITNIIEKEKSIKQQKELLEAAIENMNDATCIYDNTGSIILANSEARKLYSRIKPGISVGNVHNGYKCFDLNNNCIPVENLPTRRVLKGERIRNERIIIQHPDRNRVIEINAVPVFDSENKLISAIISHHDVSQTVAYEKELRKQKELLEDIVNNLHESLYVIDKSGKYIVKKSSETEAKPNICYDLEELNNIIKVYDLDGTEISKEQIAAYRVNLGEPIRNHIIYNMIDGVKIYYLVNRTPIFDNNGNLLYAIATTRDITDFMRSQQILNETQEELLKAELEKNKALEKAMTMKDEFLSMISHELRTPLNVISTALQAIDYFCINELSDKSKKYLTMIRQNSNRQLRLVNNLLDITRANAGRININKRNLDIIFLTRSITESVQAYAAQKGIDLTFESTLEKKIVGLDDEKYERIILNLLSNAIKFTPTGKFVKVKVSSSKKQVCVKVEDSGIGISTEHIDLIFERFGQVNSSLSRQAQGAGIGLSLVKNFVEALGGSISVKSRLGRGSAFTVLLPDNKVNEESNDSCMANLLDNTLVKGTSVEFSDIYL